MPLAFVIAGTHSGCGKTIISLGLLRLLTRYKQVKPFKVGPDYIDPAFHEFASSVPSCNLDLHLVGEEGVRCLYARYALPERLMMVEGVMGLYDGADATSWGSTAHVAKILGIPVILVVDAGKMAASAAAMVWGYRSYDPDLKLSGVILNRVNGEKHFTLLKKAIERDCGVEVLGYLPPSETFSLPERHLGLIPPSESKNLEWKLNNVADQLVKTVSVEKLLRVAKMANNSIPLSPESVLRKKEKVRIGIARDQAFHFYYPDSLSVFEELGGEWVEFSPLADSEIPEGVGGLYIGGGFPEVFAHELSENTSLMKSIKKAVAGGMPVYAECGGYLFLSRSIRDVSGRTFPMSGVFPAAQEMTSRLVNFGYVDAESVRVSPLSSRPGIVCRGHEFHHSRRLGALLHPAYRVGKRNQSRTRKEGEVVYNALGSFIHRHYFRQRDAVQNFLMHIQAYLRTRR